MITTKFVTAILVLGTVSLFFACRRGQAHNPSSDWALAATPGPGNPKAANARLEQAVRSMLDRDEQLRHARLKVDADTTKNEVTLSGTVESETMRAKAVELTKAAHVGVVVKDRISVQPGRH